MVILTGSDWFGAYECTCGAIVRPSEIVYDRECPHCGLTLRRGVLAYQMVGGERYEVGVAEFYQSEGEWLEDAPPVRFARDRALF